MNKMKYHAEPPQQWLRTVVTLPKSKIIHESFNAKIPDIDYVSEKTFVLIQLYLYIANALYHTIKVEINKQVDCQTYDYNVKYEIEIQEIIITHYYIPLLKVSYCYKKWVSI